MTDNSLDATRRLAAKKQTLDDAYAAPANFLEIDVVNPITHGLGTKRYTDYEVRMRVSRDAVGRFVLFTVVWFGISGKAQNCLLSLAPGWPRSSAHPIRRCENWASSPPYVVALSLDVHNMLA